MKNLKVGMALLIVAMLFGFVGCLESDAEEETVSVDYTNYTGTDRAIAFTNDSRTNVVLFAKSLEENNKLGGVRASTMTASGISRSKGNNTTWFGTTQAFEVVVITEEQYTKNKGKLGSIETPLTRLYVFWNKDGTNDKIYNIDNRLGGNEYYLDIILPLTGGWNAELRDKGTAGPPIGYAAQGILKTQIYILPDSNFNIFPVFHRWNNIRDVLEVAFPKDGEGEAWQVDVSLGTFSATKVYTINLRNMMSGLNANPNVGAAYVNINNSVAGSMIQMTIGDQPKTNPLGVSLFGPGTKTFQIDMPQTTPSNFAASAPFSGVKIGMTSREQALRVIPETNGATDATDETAATINLANGKIYTVTVTGDNQYPSQIKSVMDLRTDASVLTRVVDFKWD